MKTSILLLGLHPDAVDFGKWPDLNPQKLQNGLDHTVEQLNNEGYQSEWLLLFNRDDDFARLATKLAQTQPKVVVIGAGVRLDPEHTALLEKLINQIKQQAPDAQFAFNTSPDSTVAAIKRWA